MGHCLNEIFITAVSAFQGTLLNRFPSSYYTAPRGVQQGHLTRTTSKSHTDTYFLLLEVISFGKGLIKFHLQEKS